MIFGDLLKRYQTEHPGVTIDLTDIPGTTATDIYQWVTTHSASKSLATIVNTFPDQIIYRCAGDDEHRPVGEFYAVIGLTSPYTGQNWRGDFAPDLLIFAKYGLKNNYAVPFTRYKSAWVYNKDAWAKAGLTDADVPKTWKQWFTAMDKLKAAGLIPIARAGDVQTTSHTCWILMISLDRKQWDAITGGNQFMSLQQKIEAVCSGKWPYDTPWARAGWPAMKKLLSYYEPGASHRMSRNARQLFYEGKGAMMFENQAVPPTL